MRSHVTVGEEVDHFHLDRLITSTPVASMFRAVDLKTQQPVMLKFPNPDVESDPVLSDRFKREEEIGRTLDHPGLLKASEEASGQSRPYIVTEWFDGQLLRSLLNEEKKLAPARAMKIALHVCDVLDYVENHGVFHRNIRPENIMVGADDNIKLINFGTAAMIGARRITFTNLSQAVGISDYIAPEELSGKRVDARSDVYSLGAVLYEMLTGRTPFQGLGPFERQGIDPFESMRTGTQSSSEIDAAVSPQLKEVILRSLQPNPASRYANAHELAHDLRHLDQVKITKRLPIKSGSAVSKKVAMFAVLALLPLIIFALLFWFARH